jgi:hypothetical protein
MRIACVLAVVVALAGLGTLTLRAHEPAASRTPAAFIDLGGIFGNENEPDENEPDDGGRAQRPAQGGSRITARGMLLGAAIGAIVALFVASRLRRLRARLRRWGAGRSLLRSTDRRSADRERPTPDRPW